MHFMGSKNIENSQKKTEDKSTETPQTEIQEKKNGIIV